MNIKKAQANDFLEVARLFNQYRIFYGQEDNLSLAEAFIEARLKNNESVIFIAMNKDGSAIGFTQLYPSFSSISAKRAWILNDLYVSKCSRGKGVATGLLQAAKSLAISSQANGLSLQTAIDNIAAQKLYENAGFRRDTEFYSYTLT